MLAWRATGSVSAIVPPGVISQFAGSSAPSGYLLCTGQSVTTASYPGLFAVIGYTYGGSGANFTVPNLQGRIPIGAGSITDVNANSQTFTLAGTGGELSHRLTTPEMPSHTHVQNAHTHTQDAHSHSGVPIIGNVSVPQGSYYGVLGSYGQKNTDNATATNQNTTATNQNTGGDGYHNNIQPYLVVNYIIKT
jgi:microcystin-dependent protein